MTDEYIEREAVLALKKPFPTSKDSVTLYQQYFISPSAVEKIPAADVVARDCFDKILAENDDMRAIIDTYGGLENIQSAFVKLHEIETADVRPVRHGRWVVSRIDYNWLGVEYPTHCKCDQCGREIPYLDRDDYCPTCGARMDGDGE